MLLASVLVWLVNYTEPQTITIPASGTDRLTGETVDGPCRGTSHVKLVELA